MANEKRLISLALWEEFKNEVTKDLECYDHYDSGYEDAIDRVDDWLFCQPEREAVEVVHGRWEYGKWEKGHWVKGNERCRCSVCHRDFAVDNQNIWIGCPHCLAKMDGDGNA